MDTASLAGRFADHVERSGLLRGPATAVLAVSGGPDSLALLDLVAARAAHGDLRLLVAHADHGIHPASGEVAARLASLARERYGLETVIGALGLGPRAGETLARKARYRFLREVQSERGARWLATAHHADDQAETVLLRMLRGSAPAGLAGIAAVGPRGLVRPLLPFRRAELAAHVGSLGLAAFEDPANTDPRHMRSWVRGELMPLIERRLEGNAHQALLAVSRHAAQDSAAWDTLLEVLPGLDARFEDGRFDVARGALAGYHKPLAVRILRAAARRAGLRLGPSAASRIVALSAGSASGRRIELGDGISAETAFERLAVGRSGREDVGGDEKIRLEGGAGERGFNAYRFAWRSETAPRTIARGGWTTWLLPGPLAVRPAARGELLVPLGGVGRREVRRLLMEARVPRGERARYPLVTWRDEAVWLPGVCRGAAAVPRPGEAALRIDVTAG